MRTPASDLPCAGVEQDVQVVGLAVLQRLPRQRHGHFHQPRIPRRGPHRQVTIVHYIVGIKQLLATHVLVARGDVAFADMKLVRPARNGVLVITDQSILALEQIPGAGSPAERIDLIPRQMPPPAADGVAAGATHPTGQQRKAKVFHLVEVPDTVQPYDRGKDAGQQPARQCVEPVAHAVACDVQPVEGFTH